MNNRNRTATTKHMVSIAKVTFDIMLIFMLTHISIHVHVRHKFRPLSQRPSTTNKMSGPTPLRRDHLLLFLLSNSHN